MNLEQLTKHQIVLLTLLVSFVTSMATGIVAVALMDQAPPSVTRTINQIVEHTVEKVVPSASGAATTTITEKTVVVKDDDLTAQSIASVQKAVIRIVEKGGDKLIARGVITSSKGMAITDQASLEATGASSFEAILYSGERVGAALRKQTGSSTPLGVLDLSVGTSTGFAPISVGDESKLKLGQSVIRIGGTGQDIVGSGIIAALPKDGSWIEATVTSATPGSVLLTLFGEVIGLATTDSLSSGADFYTTATAPAPPPAPAAKTTSH